MAERSNAWRFLEAILAFGSMAVIGARYVVWGQITIGYLIAFALLPVTLTALWRLAEFRRVVITAVLAVVGGGVLILVSTATRAFDTTLAISVIAELLGVIACAAVGAWAMGKIGIGAAVAAFGLGMFATASRSDLFASDPWRFGYALPVTIILLAVATMIKKPAVEYIALMVACASSALSGSRSVFAVQLIALLILALWRIPRQKTWRPPGVVISLLGLGVALLAGYNLGQSLLLEGYLGESAQARSEMQIETSGSLILGGRPEIAASAALVQDSIIGYGPGVAPNWEDVQVAKAGMITIGYDPDNGYVNSYMFGRGFELHSVAGNLWATFGLIGLGLAALMAWQSFRSIQRGPVAGAGDALLLYLALRTLWNTFFAPWYASIPIVILLFGLMWARQQVRTP